MNELQIFNYNNNEIRTIEKEDGVWWVLADVCKGAWNHQIPRHGKPFG